MTNKKTALPVCTPRSECNHRIRATVFPFVSGSKIGAKNVFGSVGFFHKQKGRGRGEKEKRENAALSNASTINLVSTANAITRPSPRTSIVNVAPHVPPLPLPHRKATNKQTSGKEGRSAIRSHQFRDYSEGGARRRCVYSSTPPSWKRNISAAVYPGAATRGSSLSLSPFRKEK